MRITFVIPNANLSGGIRIVAEHARMLHERGHRVTVIAGRRRKLSLLTRIKARLRGRPIARHRSQATHLDNMPFCVHTIDKSRAVIESDVPDADLILATWWETAEWVAEMPACKGVKVCLHQGYEVYQWSPVDRIDTVWRLPMRKVVVSRWLEDIARDQFGDDTALLVPNGLDTEHFGFVGRGLSGQKIIGAMYSGMSRDNFKRFWLAHETVRVLKARGVDCRFVGFGAQPADRGELLDGSCFEAAPSQHRIAEIYASCDCWLFTSDKEGYGLPLLEAMSTGTPVVATHAGAAPELLKSGGGTLVDSDNPENLADAVEGILNLDDSAWRAMSQTARAEAELHSWDRIGDAMESALMRILDESRLE